MSAIEVSINSVPVDNAYLLGARIVFDIRNIIGQARFIFNDFSGALVNSIQLGTPIELRILDPSKGSVLKTLQYGVASVEKLPLKDALSLQQIKVEAISQWVFLQGPQQKAYFGTISQIVKQVMQRDKFFNNVRISNTTDKPRIRYQLRETPSKFLQKICKYAIEDSSPMFFFSNMDNDMLLVSEKALVTSSSVKKLIPYSGNQAVPDLRVSSPLPILSLASYGDLRKTANPDIVIPSIKQLLEADELNSNFILSNKTAEKFSFGISGYVEIGKPLDLPPDDFFAKRNNEIELERQEQQQLVVIIPFLVEAGLDLGSAVSAEPLSTDSLIENGKYMINRIEIIQDEQRTVTPKVQLCRKGDLS